MQFFNDIGEIGFENITKGFYQNELNRKIGFYIKKNDKFLKKQNYLENLNPKYLF